MSETNTPASTEVFGRDAVELKAGFVPMPDDKKPEDNKSELTAQEAAEEVAEHRKPATTFAEGTSLYSGKPLNETVTPERAARDLADQRREKAAEIEAAEAQDVAAEVDKLRGESPEAKAEVPPANEATPAAPRDDGLDHDVAEALQKPQVRKAIEEEITRADAARTTYEQAATQTLEIARATLFAQFPEFKGLTAEQVPTALQIIGQQSPQRYNQIVNSMQGIAEIVAHAEQAEQDKAERKAQEFASYRETERKAFEDATKNIPASEMSEIYAAIPSVLKSYGMDQKQFADLLASDEGRILHSAGMQRVIVDAIRYHRVMGAGKAVPTRAVPTVQKPGTANGHRAAETDTIRTLAHNVSRTTGHKSIAAAAKLLSAQRRGRSQA